jgi:uncharacterized membrane protein
MESCVHQSKVYGFLRMILNLGFWLSLAAFLLFLISLPAGTIFHSNLQFSPSISFDGLLFTYEVEKTGAFYWQYVLMVSVVYALGLFCIWTLRGLVYSLDKDSPFTQKNVNRIRTIGWAVLIQSYLRQLTVYQYVQHLLQTAANREVNSILQTRFNLLPEGAVLALCILILAEVFRYGCVLQQEHDTTV